MAVENYAPGEVRGEVHVAPPAKTKGEVYEGIAFSFCKAATIVLLIHILQAARFTLPIVAGAAAVFYLLAHLHGQRETRCVLQKPLIIAVFWGALALGSLWATLHPMLKP